MSKLVDELKRRKVFRVAGLYAVVAWVLIQVTDVVLPTFGAPAWVNQTVIFLFVLGFIPTLIAAWAYEITPDGVKPDHGSQTSTPIQVNQNQWLVYATFALVLLVAGFQIGDRYLGAGAVPGPAEPLALTPQPPYQDTVTKVSVHLREEEFFHFSRGDFTMSADGKVFVYRGVSDNGDAILWMRRWDELSGRPIPNTEDGHRPKVSPDGSEVVFAYVGARGAGANSIAVASLRGGAARILVSGGDAPNWSPDGDWIYYKDVNDGISRVPSGGGPEEVVAQLNKDNGEAAFSMVEVLPGNNLIYGVDNADGSVVLQTFNAETGRKKNLIGGQFPIYSPSGHLLFQVKSGATLLAAPFNSQTLELTGPVATIAEGLLLVGGAQSGNVAVSDRGRLIYRTGNLEGRRATPMWVDRTGNAIAIVPDWVMFSNRGLGIPSLSPAGDKIATAIENNSGTADIWISELSGLMSRITFGKESSWAPTWTPDGQSVVYTSTKAAGVGTNYWIKKADGSGLPQLILETEDIARRGFISNDGQWFIYQDTLASDVTRILAARTDNYSEPIILMESDLGVSSPALSPDGRWLAYTSVESGEWEIYVQPFPEVDAGRWQISVEGGTGPLWAKSGKELFYVNGNQEMVAVVMDATDTPKWGAAESLFSVADYRTGAIANSYDIDTDDQRFVMMGWREVSDTELIMVDNWFAELNIAP